MGFSGDSASGGVFLCGFGDVGLVGGGVHQAGDFLGIGELHFDEPRGVVRIVVDFFGRVRERGIGFGDFAGDRTDKFR